MCTGRGLESVGVFSLVANHAQHEHEPESGEAASSSNSVSELRKCLNHLKVSLKVSLRGRSLRRGPFSQIHDFHDDNAMMAMVMGTW